MYQKCVNGNVNWNETSDSVSPVFCWLWWKRKAVIQKHNGGALLQDDLSLWTVAFHERTPASRLRTWRLIVSFLLDWKTNVKISEEWPLWEPIWYDRHVAAHVGVGLLVTLILQRKLWRGRKIIKKYCMINKSPKYQTDVITWAW